MKTYLKRCKRLTNGKCYSDALKQAQEIVFSCKKAYLTTVRSTQLHAIKK